MRSKHIIENRIISLLLIVIIVFSSVSFEVSAAEYDPAKPNEWNYETPDLYTQENIPPQNWDWNKVNYELVHWERISDYTSVDPTKIPSDKFSNLNLAYIPKEKLILIVTNVDKLVDVLLQEGNTQYLNLLSGEQLAQAGILEKIEDLNLLDHEQLFRALRERHSNIPAGAAISIIEGITYSNGRLINPNIPGGLDLNSLAANVASITAVVDPNNPNLNGFLVCLTDGTCQGVNTVRSGAVLSIEMDGDNIVVIQEDGTRIVLRPDGDITTYVDQNGNIIHNAKEGTRMQYQGFTLTAQGSGDAKTKFVFSEKELTIDGPAKISSANVNGAVHNGGKLSIKIGANVNDISIDATKAHLNIYGDTFDGNFRAEYAGGRVQEYTIVGKGSWSEISGFKDDEGNPIRDTYNGEGEYKVVVQNKLTSNGLEAFKILFQREKLMVDLNKLNEFEMKLQGLEGDERESALKQFLESYNDGLENRRNIILDTLKRHQDAIASAKTDAERTQLNTNIRYWQAELERLVEFTSESQIRTYLDSTIERFNERLSNFETEYSNVGWKSRTEGIIINKGLVRTGTFANTFEMEGLASSSYTAYRPPNLELENIDKQIARIKERVKQESDLAVKRSLQADIQNLEKSKSNYKAVMFIDSPQKGIDVARGVFRYQKEGEERGEFEFKVSKDEDGKSTVKAKTKHVSERGKVILEKTPSVRLAIDGEVSGINYLDINADTIIAAEQLTDEGDLLNSLEMISGEKLQQRAEQFVQTRSGLRGYSEIAQAALNRQRREIIEGLNAQYKTLQDQIQKQGLSVEERTAILSKCGQDEQCQQKEVSDLFASKITKAFIEQNNYQGQAIELQQIFEDIANRDTKTIVEQQKELRDEYKNLGQIFDIDLELGADAQKLIQVVTDSYIAAPENVQQAYNAMLEGARLSALNQEYDAIAAFRKAALQGDDFQKLDSWNTIGQIYANRGEYQNARTEFERVLAQNPNDLNAMQAIANSYVAEGNFGIASATLRNMKELADNLDDSGRLDVISYNAIVNNIVQTQANILIREASQEATLEGKRAKLEEAAKLLADRKLSTVSIEDQIRTYELRDELAKDGNDLERRSEIINQIIAINPSSHTDYQQLGQIYEGLGRTQDSIEATDTSQQLLLGKLAQAGFDVNALGMSQFNYNQFITETSLRQARGYYSLEKYDVARQASSFNLAIDKTDINAQRILSNSFFKEERNDDAIISWQKFERENTGRIKAEGTLGLQSAYLENGDYSKVRDVFKSRQTSIHDDYVSSAKTLATVSYNKETEGLLKGVDSKTGDEKEKAMDAVSKLAKEAIEFDGKNQFAAYALRTASLSFMDLGRYDKAVNVIDSLGAQKTTNDRHNLIYALGRAGENSRVRSESDDLVKVLKESEKGKLTYRDWSFLALDAARRENTEEQKTTLKDAYANLKGDERTSIAIELVGVSLRNAKRGDFDYTEIMMQNVLADYDARIIAASEETKQELINKRNEVVRKYANELLVNYQDSEVGTKQYMLNRAKSLVGEIVGDDLLKQKLELDLLSTAGSYIPPLEDDGQQSFVAARNRNAELLELETRLEQLEKDNPEDIEIKQRLAKLKLSKLDFDGARTRLEASLELVKDDRHRQQIQTEIAISYLDQRNKEKAAEEFEKVGTPAATEAAKKLRIELAARMMMRGESIQGTPYFNEVIEFISSQRDANGNLQSSTILFQEAVHKKDSLEQQIANLDEKYKQIEEQARLEQVEWQRQQPPTTEAFHAALEREAKKEQELARLKREDKARLTKEREQAIANIFLVYERSSPTIRRQLLDEYEAVFRDTGEYDKYRNSALAGEFSLQEADQRSTTITELEGRIQIVRARYDQILKDTVDGTISDQQRAQLSTMADTLSRNQQLLAQYELEHRKLLSPDQAEQYEAQDKAKNQADIKAFVSRNNERDKAGNTYSLSGQITNGVRDWLGTGVTGSLGFGSTAEERANRGAELLSARREYNALEEVRSAEEAALREKESARRELAIENAKYHQQKIVSLSQQPRTPETQALIDIHREQIRQSELTVAELSSLDSLIDGKQNIDEQKSTLGGWRKWWTAETTTEASRFGRVVDFTEQVVGQGIMNLVVDSADGVWNGFGGNARTRIDEANDELQRQLKVKQLMSERLKGYQNEDASYVLEDILSTARKSSQSGQRNEVSENSNEFQRLAGALAVEDTDKNRVQGYFASLRESKANQQGLDSYKQKYNLEDDGSVDITNTLISGRILSVTGQQLGNLFNQNQETIYQNHQEFKRLNDIFNRNIEGLSAAAGDTSRMSDEEKAAHEELKNRNVEYATFVHNANVERKQEDINKLKSKLSSATTEEERATIRDQIERETVALTQFNREGQAQIAGIKTYKAIVNEDVQAKRDAVAEAARLNPSAWQVINQEIQDKAEGEDWVNIGLRLAQSSANSAEAVLRLNAIQAGFSWLGQAAGLIAPAAETAAVTEVLTLGQRLGAATVEATKTFVQGTIIADPAEWLDEGAEEVAQQAINGISDYISGTQATYVYGVPEEPQRVADRANIGSMLWNTLTGGGRAQFDRNIERIREKTTTTFDRMRSDGVFENSVLRNNDGLYRWDDRGDIIALVPTRESGEPDTSRNELNINPSAGLAGLYEWIGATGATFETNGQENHNLNGLIRNNMQNGYRQVQNEDVSAELQRVGFNPQSFDTKAALNPIVLDQYGTIAQNLRDAAAANIDSQRKIIDRTAENGGDNTANLERLSELYRVQSEVLGDTAEVLSARAELDLQKEKDPERREALSKRIQERDSNLIAKAELEAKKAEIAAAQARGESAEQARAELVSLEYSYAQTETRVAQANAAVADTSGEPRSTVQKYEDVAERAKQKEDAARALVLEQKGFQRTAEEEAEYSRLRPGIESARETVKIDTEIDRNVKQRTQIERELATLEADRTNLENSKPDGEQEQAAIENEIRNINNKIKSLAYQQEYLLNRDAFLVQQRNLALQKAARAQVDSDAEALQEQAAQTSREVDSRLRGVVAEGQTVTDSKGQQYEFKGYSNLGDQEYAVLGIGDETMLIPTRMFDSGYSVSRKRIIDQKVELLNIGRIEMAAIKNQDQARVSSQTASQLEQEAAILDSQIQSATGSQRARLLDEKADKLKQARAALHDASLRLKSAEFQAKEAVTRLEGLRTKLDSELESAQKEREVEETPEKLARVEGLLSRLNQLDQQIGNQRANLGSIASLVQQKTADILTRENQVLNKQLAVIEQKAENVKQAQTEATREKLSSLRHAIVLTGIDQLTIDNLGQRINTLQTILAELDNMQEIIYVQESNGITIDEEFKEFVDDTKLKVGTDLETIQQSKEEVDSAVGEEETIEGAEQKKVEVGGQTITTDTFEESELAELVTEREIQEQVTEETQTPADTLDKVLVTPDYKTLNDAKANVRQFATKIPRESITVSNLAKVLRGVGEPSTDLFNAVRNVEYKSGNVISQEKLTISGIEVSVEFDAKSEYGAIYSEKSNGKWKIKINRALIEQAFEFSEFSPIERDIALKTVVAHELGEIVASESGFGNTESHLAGSYFAKSVLRDRTAMSQDYVKINSALNLQGMLQYNPITMEESITPDLEQRVLSDYHFERNKLAYDIHFYEIYNGEKSTSNKATLYHKNGKTFKVIFEYDNGDVQVATLDIQDFKFQINTRYGHLVGDDYLKNIGKAISSEMDLWDGSEPVSFLEKILTDSTFKEKIIQSVPNQVVENAVDGDFEQEGDNRPLKVDELNFYAGVSQRQAVNSLADAQKLNDQSTVAGKSAQLTQIGGIDLDILEKLSSEDIMKIKEGRVLDASTVGRISNNQIKGEATFDEILNYLKRIKDTKIAAYSTDTSCCQGMNVPQVFFNEYEFFGETLTGSDLSVLFKRRLEAIEQKDLASIERYNDAIWEAVNLNQEFAGFIDGLDIFKLVTNKLLDEQGQRDFAQTFIIGGDEIGYVVSGDGKVDFARIDINNFGKTNQRYGVEYADSLKRAILKIINNNIQTKGISNAEIAQRINKEISDYVISTGKTFSRDLVPSVSIGVVSVDKGFNYIDAGKLNMIADSASEKIKLESKAKVSEGKSTLEVVNEGGFFVLAEPVFERINDVVPTPVTDSQAQWVFRHDLNEKNNLKIKALERVLKSPLLREGDIGKFILSREERFKSQINRGSSLREVSDEILESLEDILPDKKVPLEVIREFENLVNDEFAINSEEYLGVKDVEIEKLVSDVEFDNFIKEGMDTDLMRVKLKSVERAIKVMSEVSRYDSDKLINPLTGQWVRYRDLVSFTLNLIDNGLDYTDRLKQIETESLSIIEQLRALDLGVLSDVPATNNYRALLGQGFSSPEFIGRGTFADVFVAEQNGQKVAVKVLRKDTASRQSVITFKKEPKIISNLNHPNIVKVVSSNVNSDNPYFTQEYVSGESLEKRVKSTDKPLTVQESAEIAVQVFSALEYAHSKNVVHRDIKPSNVMVEPDGNIKLIDFGLAGFSDDVKEELGIRDLARVGTLDYAAPEVLDPNKIKERFSISSFDDSKTDVYSAGWMIYEMLTKEQPVLEGTKTDLSYKVDTSKLRAQNVPSSLVEIIEKSLFQNPNLRPTAAEMKTAFENVIPSKQEYKTKKQWLTEFKDELWSEQDFSRVRINAINTAVKNFEQNGDVNEVNKIMTAMQDAALSKAAELAKEKLAKDGRTTDKNYAIMISGSQARGETGVSSDLEIALIHDKKSSYLDIFLGNKDDEYFETLAIEIHRILKDSGFNVEERGIISSKRFSSYNVNVFSVVSSDDYISQIKDLEDFQISENLDSRVIHSSNQLFSDRLRRDINTELRKRAKEDSDNYLTNYVPSVRDGNQKVAESEFYLNFILQRAKAGDKTVLLPETGEVGDIKRGPLTIRHINYLINSGKALYTISQPSTQRTLEELVRRGYFNEEQSQQISQALSFFSTLRTQLEIINQNVLGETFFLTENNILTAAERMSGKISYTVNSETKLIKDGDSFVEAYMSHINNINKIYAEKLTSPDESFSADITPEQIEGVNEQITGRVLSQNQMDALKKVSDDACGSV